MRLAAIGLLTLLHAGCAERALGIPATSEANGVVSAFGLGYDFSCAVSDQGRIGCWGVDTDGELGDGAITNDHPLPVLVDGITDAIAVTGGESHACARSKDGTVRCWGSNLIGEIGAGSGSPVLQPTVALDGAIAVAASFSYTCAVRSDGTAACWGVDDHGQLGNGGFEDVKMPTDVVGLEGASDVATGELMACALRRDGSVACWGYGTLGDGTENGRNTPVAVRGLAGPASAIAAGSQHACALTDGTVTCWGYGGYGELGNVLSPDDAYELVATPVAMLPRAIAISACDNHTCAVVEDGGVYCWGGDSLDHPAPRTPVRVGDVTDAVRVSSGSQHDCVLTASGKVRCWGVNNVGQLGDGTLIDRDVPTTVLWP